MKNELNDAGVVPEQVMPWYRNRSRQFLIFNFVFAVVCSADLRDLVISSWQSDYFTYIPFIPLIAAYLVYTDRERIFTGKMQSMAPGFAIIGIAVLLLLIAHTKAAAFGRGEHLAFATFAEVVLWIGGFTTFFGWSSFRNAVLPLMFLFFTVPLPDALLNTVISFLQINSTEITDLLLKATGMPFAREGFVFHLPIMDIEVVPHCSGIRSSLSLAITGAMASILFLRTGWARIVLLLTIVPIAVLKNGIRIASLAVLGVYVDPSILASDLHTKGGFLFFLLALMIVWGVITLLRSQEKRFSGGMPPGGSGAGDGIGGAHDHGAPRT